MMDEEEEVDDEDEEELMTYLMDNDHEVGTALRDNIIPFAIRWYTGEAAPEYERMGPEDSDEDEESEEEDEDDSDDEPPPRRGGKGGGPKASAKKAGKAKASPDMKPGE